MTFAVLVWVGLAVAVVAALAAAWWRSDGVRISVVGFLVASLVAIIASAAVSTDFHDADGWADCWPSCSVLQRAVAIAFAGGPVMALAFVAGFGLALVRRGSRR